MGPERGRGRGRGKGREQGFANEADAQSHAERAAQLLAKARASSSNTTTASSSSSTSSDSKTAASPASTSKDVIALPTLIKSLANPQLGSDAMTIKEAIPIAGKLTRGKLNTPEKLSFLNSLVLGEAGITSEGDIHKILIAFGVRKVGASKSAEKSKGKGALDALSAKPAPSGFKKRKFMDDDALSREYGNINAPLNEPGEGELTDYIFNEILDEDVIKSRRAVINRAPIMTAWAIVVLEKEGFQRREALSIAHCYVHTTSTARGISLGIIPASERERSVNVIGSNQPHFELMGVKIPLMKVGKSQEWRGISQGQVVSPDNAFRYISKSMQQTLPAIMGALMLLADSFTSNTGDQGDDLYNPSTAADLLHANAYNLYTQFRPSTSIEWGKKSTFFCGKALALRRGRDEDVSLWEEIEDGSRGRMGQQSEIEAFEQELRNLVKTETEDVKAGTASDSPSSVTVKKEEPPE